MAKKYVLAAWTDQGQVHVIPSVVNDLSVPYREKIGRLDIPWGDIDNKLAWMLAKSRAHEQFARFLLRVGYPREAYVEYENAAMVCTYCSDTLWLQGTHADFPVLPLLYRFQSMHRECLRLASDRPYLQHLYTGSDLEAHYRQFTFDDRIIREEMAEARESFRAWNFGKG